MCLNILKTLSIIVALGVFLNRAVELLGIPADKLTGAFEKALPQDSSAKPNRNLRIGKLMKPVDEFLGIANRMSYF